MGDGGITFSAYDLASRSLRSSAKGLSPDRWTRGAGGLRGSACALGVTAAGGNVGRIKPGGTETRGSFLHQAPLPRGVESSWGRSPGEAAPAEVVMNAICSGRVAGHEPWRGRAPHPS